VVNPEDLSIGYEAWARPAQGLADLMARTEMTDPAMRSRRSEEGWRAFRDIWQRTDKLSLLGPAKAYTIYRLAEQILTLPGDFIECGVFRGGLSLMLGMMLRKAGSDKRVFLCDTYAGLEAPERSKDKAYSEGLMACPREMVEQSIRDLGLESHCIPEQGRFTETFRRFAPDQRFAFAHLDCDLYQCTREALQYLYPRLVEGAPVVLDDYYDESHGVMRAVNEFAEAHEIVIHLSTWGQALFIKGERPNGARSICIGPNRVHLTTQIVRNEPVFLSSLEELIRLQEHNTERLRRFVGFCRQGQDDAESLT
jgi:O-methyltransferase